jgi:hypothetical protein
MGTVQLVYMSNLLRKYVRLGIVVFIENTKAGYFMLPYLIWIRVYKLLYKYTPHWQRDPNFRNSPAKG